MLCFALHETRLRGTHYILLPKLNKDQVKIVVARLAQKGFAVGLSETLVARRKGITMHVNPAGVCWSRADPGDAISPILPEILGMPKERVRLSDLRSLYFKVDRLGGSATIRLSARLECSSTWSALRSEGEFGLSPDEKAVATFLLEASEGEVRLLTDFPTEGNLTRILGNRQYYESDLGRAEASSTLRSVGERFAKNSYLPRNGILLVDSFRIPSAARQHELFRELGEWCYLAPR